MGPIFELQSKLDRKNVLSLSSIMTAYEMLDLNMILLHFFFIFQYNK